jgi:NAD(P)-dependent dehydrogenase (short-subunit alcohol dehydrogenase family)
MKSSDFNPFSLVGKTILISGASSGIGKECAISCSKMGANLILVARNEERLNHTLKQVEGTNHLVYIHDLTNYDGLENIINDAMNKLGKISGFVHCAGIEFTSPLNLMTPKKYEELFSINVIACFEMTKLLSKKKYCSENGASFVFIASVMSVLGEVAHTGYCSSKGALISGARALSLELIEKKIRVNCISPAQIKDTDITNRMVANMSAETKDEMLKMHPMGYGEPIDVANSVIYLLSDASKWVTGINLIVDGGYSAR